MPRKAVFQPARGGAVRAFLKVIEKEPDAVVSLPQIPEAFARGRLSPRGAGLSGLRQDDALFFPVGETSDAVRRATGRGGVDKALGNGHRYTKVVVIH
jgi:hypothetical protein